MTGVIEIFKVRDQKTYDTHGSAQCVLKRQEARAIASYVTYIRYKTTFYHHVTMR